MLNARRKELLIEKLYPLLAPEQANLLQRIDVKSDPIAKITSLNLVKESLLYEILSDIIQYPYRQLEKENLSTAFSKELYLKHNFVVLKGNDVIMADPLDLALKNFIQEKIKIKKIYLSSVANIRHFLNQDIDTPDLLHNILTKATLRDASDIHFRCEDKTVHVCFRLHGILRKVDILSFSEWGKALIRLKVKSQLDISETRRPQSGRLNLSENIELRISTHPTIYGENAVIRILKKNKTAQNINQLGFEDFQVDMMREMIRKNHGLILICGPTGSGKTTTLYSLFHEINNGKKSIMTLEEPVEYKMEGITQTEIIHDDIMSYAQGIKSMLRQDPDVIFIGEIRDEITAKMCFRAAMTGHLVIATLHTSSIENSIYRLKDLGVTEEFLNVGLCGVIAQRLIRTVCKKCHAKGCKTCYFEGLYERQAIGETRLWSEKFESYKKIKDIFALKIKQGITLPKEEFEL
ncbi:MAG: Flp pilus assembly complex ATPase component TadA [Alphaproteobacteria bacterium]|nr:MAG: Flp pilus assembly complex ATPase component TadA [Alphaproteobacteria bacterium]